MNRLLPWSGVGLTFLLYKLYPSSFNTLFLINIWLFSLPHTFSTFTRSDRRKLKGLGLTAALLVLFVISILVFSQLSSMVLLYSLYFYWQQFHYGKQNLGLARWGSEIKTNWIDHSFYLSTVMVCLGGLLSEGTQNFFGYVLFNPLPFTISHTTALITQSVLLILYSCYRPAQKVSATEHVLIFSLAYLFTEHFALGWLLLNVFHNLQYLRLMKNYEKKISFLLLPLMLTSGLYLFEYHLFKDLILFSLPISLLLMMSLNFSHYTLDGLIWKKSRLKS